MILETTWGLNDFSNFRIKYPVVSIKLLLPVFLILDLFLYLSFYNLAYKVVFNFNDQVIKLFLYNKKNSISFNFNDLETIKLNWFIFLIFNSGNSFRFKFGSTFIHFLIKYDINREWGSFGKHLMKNEYKLDILENKNIY